MSEPPLLMAVPNVSEGRDLAALEAIERSLAPARFLDLHTDPDHDRAVFTLAARQGEMAAALLNLRRGRPSSGSTSRPTRASTRTSARST